MQIVDIIIILMIILGAVVGFKEGFIKKTTSFLGTFLVIVVAYSLKNPVSVLMYENLPFFEFVGIIKCCTYVCVKDFNWFNWYSRKIT